MTSSQSHKDEASPKPLGLCLNDNRPLYRRGQKFCSPQCRQSWHCQRRKALAQRARDAGLADSQPQSYKEPTDVYD